MIKKTFLIITATFLCNLGFTQTTNQWKLVFEDNFEGSSYNSDYWTACKRGTPDWKKYLVDSTATIQTNGTDLVVKLIKNMNRTVDNVPYLSGGIQSKAKFNFMYGKIDVRAKFSNGQGSWPAIWLMPENDNAVSWPDCGEIDIMERVNKETNVWQTIHSYFGNTLGITNPAKTKTSPFINNEYNVYGLEWYPDRLDFLVNGVITFTYPRILTTKTGQWPFDQKFYIILNMAGGGSWTGPITESDLPFEMKVDYVKVYKRDSTQDYATPAWSNTSYPYNSTHWKDEYVKTITSTGAQNNVNYTASAHPSGYVVLYPDTLTLTANSTFSLNLIANSLGAYTESTVLQDLRYTHCTAFADFDGDKNFETILPTIGNTPPTNGVGGNYNVMNVTQTFNVPNKTLKAGRIRVVYRNAWFNNISPEIALNEGIVYDFNVKIVSQSAGIQKTNFKPGVVKKGNRICLSGLQGTTSIAVIDLTGRIVSQAKTSDSEFSMPVFNNFCIVKVQNQNGEMFCKKF